MCVDFVSSNFSAVDNVGAGRRECTGERLHEANFDCRLRDGAAGQTECDHDGRDGLPDHGLIAFHLKPPWFITHGPNS